MKARILVLAPALVTVLGGCGGSTPANEQTQQRHEEAQRTAELQRAEALERAEGRDPRKTEAQEEAREERKATEEARRTQKEVAQERIQRRNEERQVHRERLQSEASQRAEREAEENAPDSHHYPPGVRAGFLHGCESTSGHEDAACKCAMRRIEAKVPLGRYRQNEAEVREGKPPAFIYNFEYGYCAGKEAAEGT
jgi:hypothetical protein